VAGKLALGRPLKGQIWGIVGIHHAHIAIPDVVVQVPRKCIRVKSVNRFGQ
jgi:hypothetical protein